MARKCYWCGKSFDDYGVDGNYCSNRCKYAAIRAGAEEERKITAKRNNKFFLKFLSIVFILPTILAIISLFYEGDNKSTTETSVESVSKGNNVKKESDVNKSKTNSKKDFEIFINKFISDWHYQVEHIKFPLEVVGLYGPDSYIEKDSWSEEYLGNSIFVGEDTFHDIKCKSSFKKKTAKIYTYELRRLENLQLLRRYTFEVINGKWFLVKIEM